VDDTGEVHYFPLEDSFWPFLVCLREWYAEKLLDQNGFFTMDSLRISTDAKQAPSYGVFFGPNPITLYPLEQAAQYVLLPPLEHQGEQKYRDLLLGVTRGAFAISSTCSNPAALLRWVDILYTEEGAIEAFAGVENEDYSWNEEGRWQWAMGLEQAASGALNSISVYDTGNMPWLFPLDFYNHYAEPEVERISNELGKLQAFVEPPFPLYSLTADEKERILPLQNELGRYVDEGIARFVLGQWELTEASFVEFQLSLLDRGAETFVAEWQRIHDAIAR